LGDLGPDIDQHQKNRSKFVADAVRTELDRRRREGLSWRSTPRRLAHPNFLTLCACFQAGSGFTRRSRQILARITALPHVDHVDEMTFSQTCLENATTALQDVGRTASL
jgi:hypothetical protein